MFLDMQVVVGAIVPVLRVEVQAGQIAMVTVVYQMVKDGYPGN